MSFVCTINVQISKIETDRDIFRALFYSSNNLNNLVLLSMTLKDFTLLVGIDIVYDIGILTPPITSASIVSFVPFKRPAQYSECRLFFLSTLPIVKKEASISIPQKRRQFLKFLCMNLRQSNIEILRCQTCHVTQQLIRTFCPNKLLRKQREQRSSIVSFQWFIQQGVLKP